MNVILLDLDDTLLPTNSLRYARHSKAPIRLSQINAYQQIAPYAGISEAVAELCKTLPLGIVTNSPRWYVTQILEDHFHRVRFETIVSYDDVHSIKPDPEPLITAMARSGKRASEILYVGNDLVDYESARAAGVTFIGAQWSDRRTYPHQHVIECLELMDVVSLWGHL